MALNLTIRDFAPGDLDAVLALNMHAQDPEADIPSSIRHYPVLLDIRANFQQQGAFVVGIVDYEVVAMGSIMPAEGGDFEMDYIRVAIPRQRNGYGRAIVRYLESRVASLGGRAIVLTTDAGNVPARRLYESEGYINSGEAVVFDADGNAYHPAVYRKSLRPSG